MMNLNIHGDGNGFDVRFTGSWATLMALLKTLITMGISLGVFEVVQHLPLLMP